MKVGSADVELYIYDTAGEEEDTVMGGHFIRTADVAIIMYNVTDQRSFTTAKEVCIKMEYKVLKMCLFF